MSFPESVRKLPNGNGHTGYVHSLVKTLLKRKVTDKACTGAW